VLGLWLVIAAAGTMVWVASPAAIQSLEIQAPAADRDRPGSTQAAATRGEMHGATVTLKELPPYLAARLCRDRGSPFLLQHFGIDPVGLLRAAAANVMRRGVAQGGSTITQQLAKICF